MGTPDFIPNMRSDIFGLDFTDLFCLDFTREDSNSTSILNMRSDTLYLVWIFEIRYI